MTTTVEDSAEPVEEQEQPERPANGLVDARSGPFPRTLPWLLFIGGGIGFLAAFALAVEKVLMLKDPSHVPSCSINPFLSCGSVMTKPQAELFGFPNPFLGIAGFAIVVTFGVALLAGASFRRWFWIGLQVGATGGVVLVHWLIFQSLYRIGALCPYCMVVWAVTIPIFWYVTVHNIGSGTIPFPARAHSVLVRFHSTFLTGWIVTLLALLALHFWDYWVSLLPGS